LVTRSPSCLSKLSGSCEPSRVVLGNLAKKPDYFGIAAQSKSGTQANQTVAVVHAGKGLAVTGAAVTLKAGLKSGTFSGKAFGAPTRVTGSFSC
jgi:hypothetical protein